MVPTYAMNVFKFPDSLRDDIEALLRRFWWGKEETENKIHLVNWRKLCIDKVKGGIGF